MASEKKKPTGKIILQYFLLFLFLIVLPAGSWYYLHKGLDYHKTAMEELKDYGQIPAFSLMNYDSSELNRENVAGNIVIAYFFSMQNEELSELFGERISKIHQQFDERKDVSFLFHVVDSAETAGAITSFAERYALIDREQCYFLSGDPAAMEMHARQGYKLPLEEGISLGDNPYLILADTAMTIRNYYDLRNEGEIRRLIEHIALILPRRKSRSVFSRKESE